mmetsp:Transcript_34179/g.64429  ORF Transcript_34179/g.64429 Transcript_34179/m.64429 type:complete len:144 (-) Transcript_34179:477-908(-)
MAMPITYADVASSEVTLPEVPDFAIFVAGQMLKAFAAPPSELGARILARQAAEEARGPSEEQRQSGLILVQAEATDANMHIRRVRIKLRGDGYEVTRRTAVRALEEILDLIRENRLPTGYITPARLFGSQFVERACEAEFVDV